MKKHYTYIAMVTVLTGLAACTSDELGNLFRSANDRITFTATVCDETTRALNTVNDESVVSFEGTQEGRPLLLSAAVTQRSTAITTRGHRFGDDSNDAISSFGVSAIKADKAVTASELAVIAPEFFHNLEATKPTNSDVFQISQDYYWPTSDEKLFFYAWMPYGANTGITVADASVTGPQKLLFTVNSAVNSQVDLMTAYSSTTDFTNASSDTKKNSVALGFQHELTAIRFKIGEQWLAGSIKSVAIRNVHGKGTLTVGSHEWKWKDLNADTCKANNDFVLTLEKTGLNGTVDEAIMTGDFADQYFLMIPQEFDNNSEAYIEVKYQDNAKEYTLTAPLAGKSWVRNTTVTYAISSTALTTLRIGTISWPDESPADSWSGPKTAFEDKDSIGLYVVGTNGTTILHQNVKCTYNGSSWTIHHPEGNLVYKRPGYQYFFYYPYTPTPDTNYPLQGQGNTNTAATSFFSHLIDGWTPAAVQSDETGVVFKKQDLQVGKGADHATQAPAVDVQMAHQMNLAVITLGQKNINEMGYNRVIYWLDNSYEWIHSSTYGVVSNTYNITASSTFGGANRPWKSGDTYYYVFKPVNDEQAESGPDLQGMQSDGVNPDWTETFTTQSRGKNFVRVAQSTRTQIVTNRNVDTKNATAYQLAIGDIYYNTGAISHSLVTNNTCYETPVGIVFSTSTSTTDTYAGYKHGYAMSLRKAYNGNVSAWATGTYASQQATDVMYNSDDEATQWDYIKNDLDGRTHCNTAMEKDGWAESCLGIKRANDYNTTQPIATGKSSGWYLPSSGQCYLWLKEFGGVTVNPSWRSGCRDFKWEGADDNCTSYYLPIMNSTVTNKVTEDNFDPFVLSSYEMTSTEKDEGTPYILYFRYDDNPINNQLWLCANQSVENKPRAWYRIRPVLVF